jgi:glycosyltransferase involved in cell wall biosynthesis
MKFVVVSVGLWDVEKFNRCVDSVIENSYSNTVEHVVVSDKCSEEIKSQYEIKGARYSSCIVQQKEQFYALKNIVRAIAHGVDIGADDIICIVDLDDYLLPGALETVKAAYESAPNILLTYGSYKCLSGAEARFCRPYSLGDDVRTAPWGASHLHTFKKRLWDQFPMSAAMDADLDWFTTCYDLTIMMNLMEITGLDRCKFIPTPIYMYDDTNPNNDHKLRRDQQKRDERFIRTEQPRQRRIENI